ncbi:MAG: hypothetical protein IKP86_10175, partial [Anaerolineaceae bacterium]|nr:hypothetical protein [Anaerolineaceae bacterium]
VPTFAVTATEEAPMLLHNNSGGTDATVTAPVEGTGSQGDDEDLPMITNPDRSSVPFPKTASVGFRSASSFSNINTQIVKPTEDLVIVNDNRVQYQENQSIIQKSNPTGKLQPLSYIPPSYLANGQSIQFAAGATSAVISGYVQAGGYVSYNLYAFANQNFLVLLSSDSGTSVLSVSDVYGNVFLDASQQQTSLNMYLPRTATYYVNIHSRGYAENFTLQIFIPARVTIPAGQTSAVMSGTVAPYSVVSYTAYMYAGQTARIDDYSGARPTSFLRVSGLQTGQVYMDYTSYSPSWYSVVPATQDYLIELISMDQNSYYQLTVDVR